jgi:hypothetical protein
MYPDRPAPLPPQSATRSLSRRFLFSSSARARFRLADLARPGEDLRHRLSRVISSRDSRLCSAANRSVSSVICWQRLPIRSLTVVARRSSSSIHEPIAAPEVFLRRWQATAGHHRA